MDSWKHRMILILEHSNDGGGGDDDDTNGYMLHSSQTIAGCNDLGSSQNTTTLIKDANARDNIKILLNPVRIALIRHLFRITDVTAPSKPFLFSAVWWERLSSPSFLSPTCRFCTKYTRIEQERGPLTRFISCSACFRSVRRINAFFSPRRIHYQPFHSICLAKCENGEMRGRGGGG